MTLSARNQLVGTVESVTLGDIMAHVVMRIGDQQVESVITRASAEAMKLKTGRHRSRRHQVDRSHDPEGLTGGELIKAHAAR